MRHLSLFSGYEGLGMAVEEVFGAETVAVADIDPGACKILAHRLPGVPNLGDVTRVDFRSLGRIEIVSGGFPCQDVSTAGARAGMKAGTRSGLWSEMRRAIDELRPQFAVIENVRGLLSAEADCDVEFCPWCMGDTSAGRMRALGAVLADLAGLGYDAQWRGIRASDVGAPHQRFRVFILAADRDRASIATLPTPTTTDAAIGSAPPQVLPTPRAACGGSSTGTVGLLPTPRATDGTKGGPNQRGSSGDLMLPSAVALLPTPVVNDMGEGKSVEDWDAWTNRLREKGINGNGHGNSLAIEALRALPTPAVSDATGGRHCRSGARSDELLLNGIAARQRWGEYTSAIARWEALTRPAPPPTVPRGRFNAHRLNPRFVEWMMGVPDGWITDVPGITANEALKACGNGVVPQQAVAALHWLLAVSEIAA